MKNILIAILAITVVTGAAFAAQPSVFDRYEAVRQSLLKGDIAAIHTTARELGKSAASAKLGALASHANDLAKGANIKDSRAAFAAVSQDMIAYRKGVSGASRPVVVYCSMEKRSWLQPSASPVTNPYLDASMRSCGQIVN